MSQAKDSAEVQRDITSGRRHRKGRHGFWGGLFLGGLLGALAVGAVVPVAAGGFLAHRKGHIGSFDDPERAKERAGLAVEFVLNGVDATPEQEEQVKSIVGSTIDDLVPMVRAHRESREDWIEALASADIDRVALEGLRQEELELADQVSDRIVRALADAADSLTPEQRAQLIERAARFHQ